ncbi:MAG: hypothetical protein M3066_14525 [Actinomycetota bacterium]|nr:hypothetical protein [Actinomycetota bacterium]
MIIVDDHLALLAIAGALPDLGGPGPVTTTYGFHYRLARAVSDSARSGSLSRRHQEASVALDRVVRPPTNRLLVLDPRASVEEAVSVAIERGANLLLAELVGAAVHHGCSVRITPRNMGRTWPAVMEAAGVNFATVDA